MVGDPFSMTVFPECTSTLSDRFVMDEDLLGYLLGALEPHEMRRVEERLRVDHAAQEELARIEKSLRRLDENREVNESPPPDLVSRTLASLPPLPVAGSSPPMADSPSLTPGALSSGSTRSCAATLSPMRSGVESSAGSSRGWLDWFVAAVASVILLGLLLPTIAEGRFEARKVACQDHLRELGMAITQFVMRSEQERLPAVARTGREAFAGIWFPRLHDAGLLQDNSLRWCPSLGLPAFSADRLGREGLTAEERQRFLATTRLVSVEDLYRISLNELQLFQQLAGGHYAYSLGVVDGQQYGSPRYQARSSFAVMSDAPLGGDPQDGLTSNRLGHGGRGINILYECGRVRFVPVHAIDSMPDHPLLNLRGEVEAGLNIDDAVLAPSWRGPFFNAPQR